MEWSWWKDWWRLKKWNNHNGGENSSFISEMEGLMDFDECCLCEECFSELSEGRVNEDGCMDNAGLEGEGKQVLVGVCAMARKSLSKPMKEILTRLEEFEYIKIVVFPEDVILMEPVENWPIVDCLISFHSKGFPLDKAIHYANLRNPFIINNLPMQYDIQDRRRVYAILDSEGIEIPRYAVLDRNSADPKKCVPGHELVESEDHVEVNGVTFNKPFVEKPVSAEDHNIYIYYPTSAGGGSQRLFRKIGSRSSVYSPESRVRKTGSYIYEDFMPTDGTDVKVYTVGPDYAHAEARKSPALDGKVERDSEGKEIRYPVILSNAEKLISRKVCLAFKQTVCGFDLLRANGQSFVCDVNGFSFVKNSNKYYDDCAKILGNMILRELAPTLHIPWSVPFQLDDPPIVPTTFGKMMELRCVVAVIRHGDRTPKQKMKVEVRHPKFFEIFAKYDGYKHGHVKLKRPKQLQEILDTARSLLNEIQHRAAGAEIEEKQGKLEQLKSVLEMYGHFSGINRKVQMKYQPRGRPRGSSSDDGNSNNRLGEPSLVLILKWGGELTPAGRIQAEELGRIFRCMYPGGQGRHLSGEYAGAQGLGLLRLHSTFRHDLKIYASDEGRVQMTAAAFAKGLLALEGELTPILVQMVKSANTNGLLDNDCDSSKYQNMVKTRLHELLQQDREFTHEDREQINPGNALSINAAMDFVKNPVKCCQHVHALIQKLTEIVRIKKEEYKAKDASLYHGETWELMGRRWGKIEKDFCTKHKRFDISKIPDIYDCIKYDLQHNNHILQFEQAEELYIYSKYLADIVIPQEYGLTVQEKLTIGQGICTPLLKKIRADLQRNIEESGEETVNRLNPRYSHGVSSPGRHVRTRLYFTSESHVHSLLTVLRYGGLLDVVKDEQWRRAMEYVSMVSELNYMSQIVVMLYEDPTKDPSSEERFHVELHFSPGVNCCVQKNLPPGPGFRPHSRNESSHNLGDANSGQDTASQCTTRIEEEDAESGVLEDDVINPPLQTVTPPPLVETDSADPILDSPTTSRNIDMMDLDSNMMDEPFDSGFLQSSAPIPISARTVAGHEAARLGSQLAASQRQRREREAAGLSEPRARSYDHQRQEKSDKSGACALVNEEQKPRAEVPVESPSLLSVPTGLGKPIILAHSISSPELPVPLTEASTPLITLHSIPLASPGTLSPPIHEVMPIRSSYNPPVLSQTKKYSRSQSEMTLPNIEVTGELNDDTCPPIKLSQAELSPTPSRAKVIHDKTHFDTANNVKRARSLSPCSQRCLCYNCTISELILQSRDLSPSERSNLRTYFVRSLSHKFCNCSCYSSLFDEVQKSLSDLWRDEELPLACCPLCYNMSTYDCPSYFRGTQSCRSTSPSSSYSKERTSNSFLESTLALDRSGRGTLDNISSSSTCMMQLSVPVSFDGVTVDSRVPGTLERRCKCDSRNLCEHVDSDKSSILPCHVEENRFETTVYNRSSSRKRGSLDAGHTFCRTMSCSDMGVQFNCAEASASLQNLHCLFDASSISPSHFSCFYSCTDAIHEQCSNTLGLNFDKKLISSCSCNNICNHCYTQCKCNRSKSSKKRPRPRFQTQRSFSSPDTIIQPDPTCTARRHRHSISGQMSYFKLLGYNVSKKLTGSTNSLFSTAVISGSSSAPNLKDMVPSHTSAIAAIEGFGGVPPIRPLETLHNALSLRQLDCFLEMMTSALLFRTPASSPPKFPSPGGSVCGSVIQNLNIGVISREYHSSDLEAVRYISPMPINYKTSHDSETCDIRNQPSPTSPNSTGWSSGPQSFLSSEPSSPAPTSAGECSMSISLVSNDSVEDDDDEDHDHTLTLRQSEEQKKQDVKFIFEQKDNMGMVKPSSSYKKIGRFRVESMEISDDDVRIKDSCILSSSLSRDKIKPSVAQKLDYGNQEKSSVTTKDGSSNSAQLLKIFNNDPSSSSRSKRQHFSRSQSISTPKTIPSKFEAEHSCMCASLTKRSSFSSMSSEDLKLSIVDPAVFAGSPIVPQQEPILTLASSLKDRSNIKIGFNVQDDKKD